MIPTFVISLKDDLGKQEEALIKAGIYPILFKGVNGRKGEDVNHSDRLSELCKHMCPAPFKGSGLSHLLLAQHIHSLGLPLALILEDDAYPIEKFDINHEIDKVLEEVPEDWEIIKLHTGGDCMNGSNEHKKSNGSAAAYLINTRGIEKTNKLKLSYSSYDIQQNWTFNIYKSKVNLFWTDETTSGSRNNTTYWFTPIINFINPVKCGQQNYNTILSYRVIKIPLTQTELTIYHIILFLILFFVIVFFRNYT
jgi:GR25 family glycosyltransferase involved in LPS biosynthesis